MTDLICKNRSQLQPKLTQILYLPMSMSMAFYLFEHVTILPVFLSIIFESLIYDLFSQLLLVSVLINSSFRENYTGSDVEPILKILSFSASICFQLDMLLESRGCWNCEVHAILLFLLYVLQCCMYINWWSQMLFHSVLIVINKSVAQESHKFSLSYPFCKTLPS